VSSVRHINQMLTQGLGAMTAGVVEGKERVDAEDYPLASTEMLQRIHLPVTGVATRQMVRDELDVTWPYPIINQLAAGQHESGQDVPHFASGVEILTDDPVFLDVQVRAWQQDDREFYTGATVRISAWAPEATRTTRFSAVLHLAFMGYAAASEDDNDTSTPVDLG
jgi:hypothetical protein